MGINYIMTELQLSNDTSISQAYTNEEKELSLSVLVKELSRTSKFTQEQLRKFIDEKNLFPHLCILSDDAVDDLYYTDSEEELEYKERERERKEKLLKSQLDSLEQQKRSIITKVFQKERRRYYDAKIKEETKLLRSEVKKEPSIVISPPPSSMFPPCTADIEVDKIEVSESYMDNCLNSIDGFDFDVYLNGCLDSDVFAHTQNSNVSSSVPDYILNDSLNMQEEKKIEESVLLKEFDPKEINNIEQIQEENRKLIDQLINIIVEGGTIDGVDFSDEMVAQLESIERENIANQCSTNDNEQTLAFNDLNVIGNFECESGKVYCNL